MVETADLGSFPKLLIFNNLKIVNINQRTMHFSKKGPITHLQRTRQNPLLKPSLFTKLKLLLNVISPNELLNVKISVRTSRYNFYDL